MENKTKNSNASSSLNKWIDNNTGLYGTPLSYHERIEDCIRARGEQFAPRKKRFIYNFYYEQDSDGTSQWMFVGEHEVDNQEELWEIEKKLEKKYKANIKFNKTKTLW